MDSLKQLWNRSTHSSSRQDHHLQAHAHEQQQLEQPLLCESAEPHHQRAHHQHHHHHDSSRAAAAGAPVAAAQTRSGPPATQHSSSTSGRMVSLFGSCCGGSRRANKPKRERKHRRSSRRERRHQLNAASRTPVVLHTDSLPAGAHHHAGGSLAVASIASDSEYHDARDAWSVGDGEHSPLSSAQISPRAGSLTDHPHGDHEAYQDLDSFHQREGGSRGSSSSGSESGSSSSTTASAESSTGIAAKLVSCLSIIRASSAGDEEFVGRGTPRAHHHHHHAGGKGFKLPAGCTFARRNPDVAPDSAVLCWDECEASNFQIRSVDYMQSKVKQPSSKAIYRLIGMDLFGTDSKAQHVSRVFQLPPTGPPVVCRPAVPGGPEVVLPPLLIMNVQLPDYPAPFWGSNDGRGQSIVYYFQLREDFDPDKFENSAALGLLQRFVSNGREADGSPTRDRLKLIVRVANLEEWARVGPLNSTEFKLLQNYNEKPVLTRPQQSFHLGPNYLEVGLDVHNYAFLARKALWSYHDRLATVVWDMGFVIQGNCPEELPEQLLGCGRIYRSDFRQFKFLSDLQHSSSNLASASLTPSLTSLSNNGRSPVSATTSPTGATAGGTSTAASTSPAAPAAAAAEAVGTTAAAAVAAAGGSSSSPSTAATAGSVVSSGGGAAAAVAAQRAATMQSHPVDSSSSSAGGPSASWDSADASAHAPLVVSSAGEQSAPASAAAAAAPKAAAAGTSKAGQQPPQRSSRPGS